MHFGRKESIIIKIHIYHGNNLLQKPRNPQNAENYSLKTAVFFVLKSLAEFAARRRQRNEIIFSRDMCVRGNTARAASVEFVRHRRTNYARSRPQAF